MSTPNPVATQPAVPWYKSPVQIAQTTAAVSALVAIFPKVGQWLGITNPSDAAALVTNIFGVITILAPLVGMAFRAKSKLQPLTLTQRGAESHPNTLAANSQKGPIS